MFLIWFKIGDTRCMHVSCIWVKIVHWARFEPTAINHDLKYFFRFLRNDYFAVQNNIKMLGRKNLSCVASLPFVRTDVTITLSQKYSHATFLHHKNNNDVIKWFSLLNEDTSWYELWLLEQIAFSLQLVKGVFSELFKPRTSSHKDVHGQVKKNLADHKLSVNWSLGLHKSWCVCLCLCVCVCVCVFVCVWLRKRLLLPLLGAEKSEKEKKSHRITGIDSLINLYFYTRAKVHDFFISSFVLIFWECHFDSKGRIIFQDCKIYIVESILPNIFSSLMHNFSSFFLLSLAIS